MKILRDLIALMNLALTAYYIERRAVLAGFQVNEKFNVKMAVRYGIGNDI